MNDRRNLKYAFELNNEMTSIEGQIKHLDEINKAKIDLLTFTSCNREHSIYWPDIQKLGLETEIQKIVEIIQNKRRNLLTEKENEFKKL